MTKEKPYNVRVSVRNNLLLQAIHDAGFESQAAFARHAGVSVVRMNALIALREAPIAKSGEFTALARNIMEVLGACPSDLWTEEQLTMSLRRNTASAAVDLAEMQCLLQTGKLPVEIEFTEEIVESKQFSERVRELIFDGTLTAREAKVLKMRFGIECAGEFTLDEVAKSMYLTRERIRQIEAKALRKIRQREACSPMLVRLVSPDGLTDGERRARRHEAAIEAAKWPVL